MSDPQTEVKPSEPAGEKADASAAARLETSLLKQEQDRRNRMLALTLVGFVVLLFVITVVRIGGNVTELIERPF